MTHASLPVEQPRGRVVARRTTTSGRTRPRTQRAVHEPARRGASFAASSAPTVPWAHRRVRRRGQPGV